MIITVIDEFQQLNLFVFELLFYVIGDMSVKSIVKFVVFLTSLLKKSTNYLKSLGREPALPPLSCLIYILNEIKTIIMISVHTKQK